VGPCASQPHPGAVLLAQPLTIVIGAPVAALLIEAHGLFGLEGWRVMFAGVALPAIVVGVIAWFYLADRPADAKWLDPAERKWLTAALQAEQSSKRVEHVAHAGAALKNPRVWLLALVYFGLIYGLYARPSSCRPSSAASAQFGSKFNVFQKGDHGHPPAGRRRAVPVEPRRHPARRAQLARGLPALMGAISIPAALYMQSPAATVLAITVTACAIFSALPTFWSIPARFLSGAAAAAGIALINTVGNAPASWRPSSPARSRTPPVPTRRRCSWWAH
jgi:MFS family permease